MSVITISRQYGSGGDEVADRLCEILGYKHFDKGQVDQAAAESGLAGQHVVDYSEDNYRVQSFFDRLFGQAATMAQMMAWMEGPAYFPESRKTGMMEDDAIALVQRAILTAYRIGNMVIVGRGGQVMLRNYPHVLHVRIEAPLELRIQRVIHQLPSENKTEQEKQQSARDLIQKRDVASAEYIQTFYHADWKDMMLYHGLLNMGKLSIEQAVQTIIVMLQQVEGSTTARF